MFKPVSPLQDIPRMEEAILRFWQTRHIFEKTRTRRAEGPQYVFYEGPPTANGPPGVHHALARAFKDMFPRYKVMQGHHVIRRGGWDTHGLPVEIEVERQLGFTSKQQIEAYGIERFNERCRHSVFAYIQDWGRFTDRIGFWVDLEDAYVTYTRDYIESVWWILKSFWDQGLIYQGHKVVPYCPRCGTPLSDHEVAQGYREVDDPSLYVRLPLVEDPGTSLLVWTTTPWTLPGNVAVAAHSDVDYVIVERDVVEPSGGARNSTERLILAKALIEQVFGEEKVRVYETFKGKRLKNLRYKPLFTYLVPEKPAYLVINAEFVTTQDGTGLVHLAPAFGADDLQAAQDHDLPVLQTVAPDGSFIPQVGPWRGKFVKDADPEITADLERRGLLFRSETYTHTYPFCWRCNTPLLYYARSTWFLRTTHYKERLVTLNEQINWVPEHIKQGRFGDWLANNIDWALGRERYWGTPLPIWICMSCGHQHAVGSLAELSQLAGEDLSGIDLHRPHVDRVHFTCPECQGKMERVKELIDVWFDSGAMPVAQWHYPFDNELRFREQFPADFICEAVDQTRGWFYALHAISTLLFDSPAFKNVICLGLILDGDGQKMSKSRGNTVDPWDVLNAHGADAFRWYLYTASPPGQERRFSVDLVGEVVRNFNLTLWNVYSFFVTYADLDEWQPGTGAQLLPLLRKVTYSQLDRWLLSRLHNLVCDVTEAYENYDVPGATRPIQEFVELLSNWYVRRSRRRFWRSGTDADKSAAYAALYETLVTLCKLLAPAMPFLAEELYQNLVRNTDPEAPESVHLADWPAYEASLIDEDLQREMALVMKLVSLGHAARSKAGIKVRQPLAEAAFAVGSLAELHIIETYRELLAEELNVHHIRSLGSAGDAVAYMLNPLPKQLGQKYKARFPQVRQAILELDPAYAAELLQAGKNLPVVVDGEMLEIRPDEVDMLVEARAGLVVAAEGGYLAALSVELTSDLIREGLAREVVRRIQELRKQAGLHVADRIHLRYEASALLAEAIHIHRADICQETLAVSLEAGHAMPGMASARAAFDGETLALALEKTA
jgi:isoleucyl-tRNA synthetase